MNPTFFTQFMPRSAAGRIARSIFLGVPSEVRRWLQALAALRRGDVLIVLGTGILTDAFGLTGWGPYSLFKWCAAAKLRGCKVLFVSVGAGPLYHPLGRFFAKSALALADFCSFRDESSREYMRTIGFHRESDHVFPDVVFGLSRESVPPMAVGREGDPSRRPSVGIGVMRYSARYSTATPNQRTFPNYLVCLAAFGNALLAADYSIRVLIGDECDDQVAQELVSGLHIRMDAQDEKRVVYEVTDAADQLAVEIDQTDLVVATRYHNILSALLAEKPVIAISFHPKVTAMMSDFGLAEYCLDIDTLTCSQLLEAFEKAKSETNRLKVTIVNNLAIFRSSLEKQYTLIADCINN